MKNFILVTLVGISITFQAQAKTLTLVRDRGQILIPQIEDWELAEDMFGMPFIYFSPQENGQRSNISFTATGVETEVDLTTLGKNQNSYKDLKNKWAETVHAKPLNFVPYKLWKNTQGHRVHEIGFEYEHESKQYVESSYYVDCRGKLIFAKSLRLKANANHQSNFENLVKNMDCGL